MKAPELDVEGVAIVKFIIIIISSSSSILLLLIIIIISSSSSSTFIIIIVVCIICYVCVGVSGCGKISASPTQGLRNPS